MTSVRNVPIDKELYEEAKKRVRARVKVWPSAYASGQLVQEYKRMGGRYRTEMQSQSNGASKGKNAAKTKASKSNKASEKTDGRAQGNLTRWFNERWVNVCEPKRGGRYVPCGRKRATTRAADYPYCRPSVRVSSRTPKTVGEMSAAELRRMCAKKRSTPQARGGQPTRNPVAKRASSKKK